MSENIDNPDFQRIIESNFKNVSLRSRLLKALKPTYDKLAFAGWVMASLVASGICLSVGPNLATSLYNFIHCYDLQVPASRFSNAMSYRFYYDGYSDYVVDNIALNWVWYSTLAGFSLISLALVLKAVSIGMQEHVPSTTQRIHIVERLNVISLVAALPGGICLLLASLIVGDVLN